jgi:hypothetical protein
MQLHHVVTRKEGEIERGQCVTKLHHETDGGKEGKGSEGRQTLLDTSFALWCIFRALTRACRKRQTRERERKWVMQREACVRQRESKERAREGQHSGRHSSHTEIHKSKL